MSLLLAASIPVALAGELGRKQDWLTPTVANEDPLPLEEVDDPLLPMVPPEEIRSPLARSIQRVHLQAIVLEGNTVLPRAAVQQIVQGYLDRPVTDADLHALREALSRLYLSAGYLSSGVIIPDQEVTDATLYLRAIEGGLSSITVTGDHRLEGRVLAKWLESHVSIPLNVHQLRDGMRLLLRDTNIKGLDARILPGEARGESSLLLDVEMAPPAMIFLSTDNHRSEAIGAEQVRVGFSHTNLTGRGDSLQTEIGLSDGADAGSVVYRLPVQANGTAVSAYYQRDNVHVIEPPFDALDIDTQTDVYGLSLFVPLRESLTRTLAATIGAEVKRSVTKLGGIRFSLSPGAINGESRVSALVLGVDWVRRSPNQVLALRGTVRRGLDALNATEARRTRFDDSETDAKFWSFLGQAQFLKQLSESVQLAARSTLQISDDSLLGIEKLAIGGVNTVRGYHENLLVRDNGWAASVELHWRPYHEHDREWLRSLDIVPFADYGRAWDNEDVDTTSIMHDTSSSIYIASLGLGVRWQPVDRLSVAVYWAKDVGDGFSRADNRRQRTRGGGLQEDGLHISLSYRYRF